MKYFFNKNGPLISTYLIIAIGFWLVFLIIIPQLYMFDLSFRTNIPPLLRGGPDDVYTLSHYKHFLFGSETSGESYNYVDVGVFKDTLLIAVLIHLLIFAFVILLPFILPKLPRPIPQDC